MKKLLVFLLCMGSDFFGLGMVNAQTQKPQLTLSIPATDGTEGNIFFAEVDEVDVVAAVDGKEAKMAVQQPTQTEHASKTTAKKTTATDEKVDEALLCIEQLYCQAEAFFCDNGDKKDLVYLVELLTRSANSGHAKAMYHLAWFLKSGIGCVADEKMACCWAQAAAERGCVHAMSMYGDYLKNGLACSKNEEGAVRWFREAAARRDLDAMESLATCLRHGTGCAKDPVEAFKWAYCAASNGSATAMLTVGSCLCHGNGCDRNEEAGVAWYKRGAVRGDPGSMNNLGSCLLRGVGGVIDEETGVSWIVAAAAAGHPWAMSNVGLYLLEGRHGYIVDPFRAVELFKKAIKVERTCSWAFLYLGYCYQHGIGVLKDAKKAKELYTCAVELQGNAAVQAWLDEQKKDRWLLGLINRPNDDFCIEYCNDQKKPKPCPSIHQFGDDFDLTYQNDW